MSDDSQYDQYADSWMDDDARDDEPLAPALKTCRYCGNSNLGWAVFGENWRLVDDRTGKIHVCPVNPLKEDKKDDTPPASSLDPIQRAFRAGFDAGYANCSDQAWPEVGPGGGAPGVSEAWKRYVKEPKSL